MVENSLGASRVNIRTFACGHLDQPLDIKLRGALRGDS